MSASAPVMASATAPVTYSTTAPVQYVTYASAPENVQYVDEQGNPVQTYQQPAVYGIPPEIFARLANGGSMSREEIDALMGGQTVTSTITTAAKSMKVSKKKARGCC
uniref:Uncharacterized protein n=1 Tax=Heterocapsa rotundata TaxID=89963 RepID=A8I1Z1_HETRO|nr:unknown [Heterocapsa rotundata]